MVGLNMLGERKYGSLVEGRTAEGRRRGFIVLSLVSQSMSLELLAWLLVCPGDHGRGDSGVLLGSVNGNLSVTEDCADSLSIETCCTLDYLEVNPRQRVPHILHSFRKDNQDSRTKS